jgi:predicted dehydrogenase
MHARYISARPKRDNRRLPYSLVTRTPPGTLERGLEKDSIMAQPVRVGVIGCGAISGQYFKMAPNFPILEMAACADLNIDAARARAKEFSIPRVCTVEELIADPSIEIVLNLTIPKAHAPVALKCIDAGKHTYSEKPLGVDRIEGKEMLEAAASKRVRVGCAPDTFLGSGLQTARKLIDEGAIGRPVGFSAFMLCPGHESWHPSPEFYYEPGGGPMFDMGPYYLTALLNLLGPIKRLGGSATVAIPDRIIGSEPKRGKQIHVQTPDHFAGTIEFAGGAAGVIMTSFAVQFGNYDGKQPITVYGTEGSLRVPDPNGFDGPVHLRRVGDADWREAPPAFVTGYGRAVGLADMAQAIRTGRPHRASGEQAMAVLDAMQGFLDASATGRAHEPSVPYERPDPMPAGLPFGILD